MQSYVCTGNYYSLRSQHEKAVLYFQRALKLNPNYLSAWTLMGHEYMELKQTSAAIRAYRQAIGQLILAVQFQCVKINVQDQLLFLPMRLCFTWHLFVC